MDNNSPLNGEIKKEAPMKSMWLGIAVMSVFLMSTIDSSYAAQDKSGVMKASSVIGKKVQNEEGKRLGSIKDLVINPEEGDINYAVLEFGGLMGMGDKYFAVPWEALQLSDNKEFFILNVNKKDLKTAPGFDKHNWPDMTNEKWAVTVYEFYEVPYTSESTTLAPSDSRSERESQR
jgi:sporulation protein YlmC with PRC-barrel domain